jgi:hypothetical protein
MAMRPIKSADNVLLKTSAIKATHKDASVLENLVRMMNGTIN